MSKPAITHGDTWRCFVGVPIGDELRDELTRYVDRLKQPPEARSVRWVDAAGMHLTLAFLGSLAPDTIPAITKSLRDVARGHEPFAVPTGGVGAFPSPRDMRVLWYGVDDPGGRLASLAADVASRLRLDAAPFRPHLTLARSIAGGRGHVSMATLVGAAGEPPHGQISVDRIQLYRSHLGKGPARYEVLGTAALGTK